MVYLDFETEAIEPFPNYPPFPVGVAIKTDAATTATTATTTATAAHLKHKQRDPGPDRLLLFYYLYKQRDQMLK